jgi:soluble lytic murein transglycosylase
MIVLLLLAGSAVVALWRWQDVREHSQDGSIREASRLYGVDPALVKAVVWRESRFDPEVVGSAGEVGLMQVTEAAALEWAASTRLSNFNTNVLFDPVTNAMAGSFYLARGLRRYANTPSPVTYALAEYNAGRSRVLRWMRGGGDTNLDLFFAQMDIASTRAYISAVTSRVERYRRDFAPNQGSPMNGSK